MSRDRSRAVSESLKSRYWRPADAELVLQALDESRLTVTGFCRKHSLSPARVLRWRERLGKARSGSSSPPREPSPRLADSSVRFHPVRVVGSAPSPEHTEVELLLAGDRRIVVRRGFDAALLEELVRVVEGWTRC